MVKYLKPAYRIVDATSLTEYNNLSDAQKSQYGLIISTGTVNMAANSVAHIVLWNMFGEGTDTRKNLEALLRPEDNPIPG